MHSTNWVWANKAVLDELGIAQPTTWDEFIAALQKGVAFTQAFATVITAAVQVVQAAFLGNPGAVAG